jgi:hypothetical protein
MLMVEAARPLRPVLRSRSDRVAFTHAFWRGARLSVAGPHRMIEALSSTDRHHFRYILSAEHSDKIDDRKACMGETM